ncbi:MAG: sugar MFS transporter [Flavobacteriales bacterium]|nr:sugar MFS transporter [Flavobacteriales bacterium]
MRFNRATAYPMVVLTTLFFMWGFMTVMNDVLIPHLRTVFPDMPWWQTLSVNLCFFGAYFFGSLAYYLNSQGGVDPIARFGYKRALIAGLLLSACGTALFVPASYINLFAFYLLALFVLGLGFTLLQIAANPFVAIIGAPEGASSRLNMAQAFNSLGTTLAPIIGGTLIFSDFKGDAAVRWPYVAFTVLLLLQAVWVYFTTLPEPPHVSAGKSNALRHPQLRWGMVAIFCYVGAEVAIGSLIISFLGLDSVMSMPEGSAKHFLSLYWGGAMTGRFLGAIALSRGMSATQRSLVMLALGAGMFVLLLAVNANSTFALENAWPMAVLIAANLLAFVVAGPNPSKALGLFAVAAMGLLGFVIMGEGAWAMWAVIAIGLFNSIMWSNIFTLAIDGLGNDTSQGSSLLVMMIVGGALIPPLQGAVIDVLGVQKVTTMGFHISFVLPLLCYAFLAWYGFKGSKHSPITT